MLRKLGVAWKGQSIPKILADMAKVKPTIKQIEEIFGPGSGIGFKTFFDLGEEGLKNLSEQILNSAGAAKHLADATDKGLNYQLVRLKNNLEAISITGGDQGIFGTLITAFTDLVKLGDSLARANPGLFKAGIYLALIAKALSLLNVSLLTLGKNPYFWLIAAGVTAYQVGTKAQKESIEQGRKTLNPVTGWFPQGYNYYTGKVAPPQKSGMVTLPEVVVNVDARGATKEDADSIGAAVADSLNEALNTILRQAQPAMVQ